VLRLVKPENRHDRVLTFYLADINEVFTDITWHSNNPCTQAWHKLLSES